MPKLFGKKLRVVIAISGGICGGLVGYFIGINLPPSTVESISQTIVSKILAIPPEKLAEPNFRIDLRVAAFLALIVSIPAAFIPILVLERKKISQWFKNTIAHTDHTSYVEEVSTPEAEEKTIDQASEQTALPESSQQSTADCERIHFHDEAISKAIKTEHTKQITHNSIVDAISRHNVLFKCKDKHFTDPSNTYHLDRKVDLFAALSNSDSLKHLCKVLAGCFNSKGKHLILYSKKGDVSEYLTNDAFAAILSTITNIPSQHVIYDEESGAINYELDNKLGSTQKALENQSVVIVESLLIFPHTIIDMIRGVQELGAKVKKVVILIDGTCTGSTSFTDFKSCGIKSKDVLVGASVNLKLCLPAKCSCKGKKNLQVLSYKDYY